MDEKNLSFLDSCYKQIYNIQIKNNTVEGLYQIESNDENNNIIIAGLYKSIFINPLRKYEIKGSIKCEYFSSKSFYYWGNNKL